MGDTSQENIENGPGVLSISQSVQYQDSGIVSRAITQKDSGSITLFAFDAGQELSEHTTPYEAFLYVFEGEAQVSIEGSQDSFVAGELIQLPANIPHAVKAIQRFKMMLVMLR
jgi:quercetin dioxygenase-like cupin family protein